MREGGGCLEATFKNRFALSFLPSFISKQAEQEAPTDEQAHTLVNIPFLVIIL